MTNLDELESLFFAVLEKPPAERLAFLNAACDGNHQLRARLERLLAAKSHLDEQPEGTTSTGEYRSPNTTLTSGDPTPTRGPAAVPQAGTVVAGRYKLLEEIGEGGMGWVWMAEQVEPVHRRVALKLVKPGMDSRQVLARFDAERQALALMDHPNIARVYDGGAGEDGRPYFVMELVKGTPITRYCDDERMGVRGRLELFGDVCRAVQHAHQKGVIHRDIKPSNTLVGLYDGRPVVKVIDFGIAKATGQKLTDATFHTGFGAVLGTPEYMSPEQAQLENLDIDTRSDIYSLGVLLYELLTGTTPLTRQRVKEATLFEVLRAIREEEPPRPSTRLSTITDTPEIASRRGAEPTTLARLLRGELDWIVMQALEKDRGRRYQTANGLAADIERYLKDEPVQACPPSFAYRARKFASRNRGLIVVSAVIAASLLLAVGVLGFSYTALSAKQKETEEARGKVTGALADKEKALDETERQRNALADALRDTARLALGQGVKLGRDGDSGAGLLWQTRALEMLPPGSDSLDRVIRTNISAWTRAMPQLRGVMPRESPFQTRFTADSRKLLVAHLTDLHVWSVADRSPAYPFLAHPGDVTNAEITPDGQTLVVLATRDEPRAAYLILWDLEKGVQAREPAVIPGGSWSRTMSISPDGKRLVTQIGAQKQDLELQVWDLATSKVAYRVPEIKDHLDVARIMDDGKTLLIAGRSRDGKASGKLPNQIQVRKWDLEAGKWVGEPIPINGGFDLRFGVQTLFSPKFDRVLANADDTNVVVRDVATGKAIGQEFQLAAANRVVAFSADGETLAVLGKENPSRITIWTAAGEKTGGGISSQNAVTVNNVLFSPDGKTILGMLQNRTAMLWSSVGSQLSRRPLEHRDEIQTAAYSRDGKLIITGSADGRAQLWSAENGHPIGQPVAHESKVVDVGFAPDGKTFFTLDRGAFGGQGNVRLWTVPEEEPGTKVFDRGTVAVDPVRGRIAVRVGNRPGDLFPKNIVVHDMETGKVVLGPLVHDASQVRGAGFSPDGKYLATLTDERAPKGASGATHGRVNYWDLQTGLLVARGPVTKHLDPMQSPAFSTDGKLLATCNLEGLVQVWEVPAAKLVTPPELRHPDVVKWDGMEIVYAVAFSPDGKLLATAGWDKRVRLWDTATWQSAGILHHPEAVLSVAFGAGGNELLTGCSDGRARRWDVKTGRLVGSPLTIGGWLFAVADQHGGPFLAVAGGEKYVQLWDRETEQRVGPVVTHGVDVIRLAFSHDGRSLYALPSGPGKRHMLPKPARGDAHTLRLFAEVATGVELAPNGDKVPLDMHAWLARQAEFNKLSSRPQGTDP